MSRAKLTAPQKEFFQGFVDNMVRGVIQAVLEVGEREIADDKLDALISGLNTEALRDAAGAEFLKRCSFPELKRVDRLMKSEEFAKVITASAEVGQAVQVELLSVIGPLIPEQKKA